MENDSKELVSRVSFEIVKDIAPEELDLFGDYTDAFFNNPRAFEEKDSKKREKMLGFAIPAGTAELVTGTVLPLVFGAVTDYLKRKTEGKFGNEDVRKLRDDTYNTLLSSGMSKQKAELIADSLAGKMLLMR